MIGGKLCWYWSKLKKIHIYQYSSESFLIIISILFNVRTYKENQENPWTNVMQHLMKRKIKNSWCRPTMASPFCRMFFIISCDSMPANIRLHNPKYISHQPPRNLCMKLILCQTWILLFLHIGILSPNYNLFLPPHIISNQPQILILSFKKVRNECTT